MNNKPLIDSQRRAKQFNAERASVDNLFPPTNTTFKLFGRILKKLRSLPSDRRTKLIAELTRVVEETK